MQAPRQVEMILKHGDKSSTYKFALLKGLIDYIIEHPTEESKNGFHHIPVIHLAKAFLRYYWPLWKENIPQTNNNRIRMIKFFEEFEEDFRGLNEGYQLNSPQSVLNIVERLQTARDLPTVYAKLIQDIRTKMVDQPLRKVRKVRGGMAQLFTVYHKDFSLINTDDDKVFDRGRRNIVTYSSQVDDWLELEKEEPLHVLIPHRVYEELSELRFWVDSIITKHWAEQCQDYVEESRFKFGAFFSILDQGYGGRIDLSPYKDLYQDMGVNDFYTGESIDEIEIDHFLPWSRLPVNKFWNLVPTNKKINQEKSDKLIQLNDYIRNEALPKHIKRCLSSDNTLIQNELESTYYKFFKRELKDDNRDKVVEEVRNLVLGLYDNLDQVTVGEKPKIEEIA